MAAESTGKTSIEIKRERAVQARKAFVEASKITESKAKMPERGDIQMRDRVELTADCGELKGVKGEVVRFDDAGWVHVKLDGGLEGGRRRLHVPFRSTELKVIEKAKRPSNEAKKQEKEKAGAASSSSSDEKKGSKKLEPTAA